MATEVIMPKAGMAMETGIIIQWLKQPGDRIERGEPLLEIETDKVAMEVEAEVAGFLLEIIHGAGDEVEVTKTIGYIGEKGEQIADHPPSTPRDAQAGTSESDKPGSHRQRPEPRDPVVSQSTSTSPKGEEGLRATPAARRRASENGVVLSHVEPTGTWGEVRERDVMSFIEHSGAASPGKVKASPVAEQLAVNLQVDLSGVDGSGPGGRITKRDVVEQNQPGHAVSKSQSADQTHRKPLRGLRKVIAQRMTQSHHTIPPVTLTRKMDVSALLELRRQINDAAGVRVSINDLIVKAAGAALAEAAYMRTFLVDGELVVQPDIDIGIAVAVPDGLLVPVVRKVDITPLTTLAAISRQLVQRANDRKLEPADMQGACFTVTNLGMYGISSFTPIVDLPQSGILGVNVAEDELFLEGGEVRTRKVMNLNLTIDHRIIDGAKGAEFLATLAGYIERPVQLLL